MWPPEYRCENCGWWKRLKPGFLHRLLKSEQGMGRCAHPDVEDLTWRSYVCTRHTAGAYADLKPSLNADVQKAIAAQLRKEANPEGEPGQNEG